MEEILKLKNVNLDNPGIYYSYNTTIKTYANGEVKLQHKSYDTFKGFPAPKKSGGVLDEEERERLRIKNTYKAKQNLIDLAYHNSLIEPWEYFFTLEFDSNRIDYKDFSLVSEELSKFIDNLKHQNKNMKYLLVPEYHPKTGGFHFHGLFANVPNLKLTAAINPHNGNNIYQNGSQIFNISNYRLGFTTVSKIKNQEAVSVYISKYMTKDLIDLHYKKKYWRSKNLELPKIEYAQFDEENLKFYIDKFKIKDEYIKNTEFSTSYYYRLEQTVN